jgi:hypothetical protein
VVVKVVLQGDTPDHGKAFLLKVIKPGIARKLLLNTFSNEGKSKRLIVFEL